MVSGVFAGSYLKGKTHFGTVEFTVVRVFVFLRVSEALSSPHFRRRPFQSERGFFPAAAAAVDVFPFRRPPSSRSLLPPRFPFCRLLPHFRLLPSSVFDALQRFPFCRSSFDLVSIPPRSLLPPQFSFVCPHRFGRRLSTGLSGIPASLSAALPFSLSAAVCAPVAPAPASPSALSTAFRSGLSALSFSTDSRGLYCRHSRRLPGPRRTSSVFRPSSAAQPPGVGSMKVSARLCLFLFRHLSPIVFYLPRTSPEQIPAAFRFSFVRFFLLTLKSAARGCDSVFLPFRFLAARLPGPARPAHCTACGLCLQTSPGPSFRARVEISYLSSPCL